MSLKDGCRLWPRMYLGCQICHVFMSLGFVFPETPKMPKGLGSLSVGSYTRVGS